MFCESVAVATNPAFRRLVLYTQQSGTEDLIDWRCLCGVNQRKEPGDLKAARLFVRTSHIEGSGIEQDFLMLI